MIIRQIKRLLDNDVFTFERGRYMKIRRKIGYLKNTTVKTDVEILSEKNNICEFRGTSQDINALKTKDYSTLECIPKKYLIKSTRIKYLHLIDQDAAKKFSSIIATDLISMDSVIMEMNPGFGYLTEELLNAGVPKLNLYEKLPEFVPHLQTLTSKYPERIKVKSYNFLSLSAIEYVDKVTNGKRMFDILEHVEKRLWNDEPPICIIGAVPHINFFYQLQRSLISRSLSDYGRIVLYVAILPSMLPAFSYTRKTSTYQKAGNVFLQLLFDYKILGSLPRSAFLPWPLDKVKKIFKHKYCMEDRTLMYIVKFVPKLDFFNDNFLKADAEIFYFFISIHLKRHDLRIIPMLEKWIPNCGPRLIKMNYNIFTRFSELTPTELLNLFQVFQSWPEYKTSVFLNIIDDIASRRTI